MTNTQELNSLLEIAKLEYDYFIYAKNPEKRSSNALNILQSSEVKLNNIIELKFEDAESSKIIKTIDHNVITCPYRYVLAGTASILELLNELQFSNDDKICIDITGIDAPYLFHLLKVIKAKKMISKIDLIYTAPETYKKNTAGYVFSKGIREVKQLPAYTGRTKANGMKILLIMMGFEGYRSNEVLSSIDPERTIALNGFPSYSLEFKDTSILENKDLLNSPSCKNNVSLASAHDPFETLQILSNLPQSYKKHNMIIAPIGTKPMSLGACLYCLNDESARVVFPYPNSYITKNLPAEKIGKTWIYQLIL
jgi:hypothetical protein